MRPYNSSARKINSYFRFSAHFAFRRIAKRILFIVPGFVLLSCATFKTQIDRKAEAWHQNAPDSALTLKHTMYLVGDAGNASADGSTPVLTYLKQELNGLGDNSSILFLGDNIYENGMPPEEDSASRRVAEQRIVAQLQVLDGFKGRPIFIPGNHDWRGWGLLGLRREEDFVESYLNEQRGVTDKGDWENYFLPDDGCSGPQVLELNDRVVVVVVDSQWWLGDHDEEPKINAGCAARNKEGFKFIFENVLRKYKNHTVIVAMHHPPYTYGPHGGAFTLKQHIFPLTDVNRRLWIPLPGIGSAVALFRARVGSRQDVAHQDYRALRSAVLAGARKNGSFIFASGHEHALQYIENGGQKFVVSGSASKESPVSLGKGSVFASGSMGYSVLKVYDQGETWVEFWQVGERGEKATMLFRQKVKDKKVNPEVGRLELYREYQQHLDSVEQFVSRKPIERTTKAHELLFGAHHRELYREKYTFPVLDLSTFHNGVTPVKAGGGNQTNSLRVKDDFGREYVLRGMTKDASRFLPYPFNKMVAAKYLVEDNFLATHPFAPLAIPHLADAINVYHTNPRLYYVPAQPRLGSFNDVFGGSLYLVEERPAGKHWKDAPWFGSPEKIIGTPDVVERILSSNKNQVDAAWALRTRMLDFIIGDWDRHDDQWTWASFDGPDGTQFFRPIPRDRDQAFSRYDGFIPQVARQTQPFLRQLQSYGPEIKSVKWTSWSARLFDRTFLTSLSWDQWEREVAFIQEHLSDESIRKAFVDWPARARFISEQEIVSSIKSRRDDLMDIARTYYTFLNESVDIVGTKDRERFEVERLDEAHTRVTVYDVSGKGEKRRLTFQRTFDNNVTKSLSLYGDGDDDSFFIIGDVRDGIKVRLVGGLGHDEFMDSSTVKKGGRKTIVYDDLRKNDVVGGNETLDKRSQLSRFNIYDRRGYDSEYDITIPIPNMSFNPDDIFLLGANFTMINHAFKKVPYSSVQHIGGSYAFGTQAFKLNYRGEFVSVFRHWDLYLEGRYHGPSYAFNFAGLGNNSIRSVGDPDYYRVRQGEVYLYPALKRKFSGMAGYFTVGPTIQITKTQNTQGRFISQYGADDEQNLFERKYFAGAKVGFHYDNVDNQFSPHEGIRLKSTFDWTHNVKNGDQFSNWTTEFGFYQHLDRNENVVMATQIGWSQNFGSGYAFFQMPTIGGNNGLRGYRTQRFYGDKSFWHSTDLRVRLHSSGNQILPFTMGVFGGFDYGRVWLEGESSDRWHTSYGGGLWLSPIDALTISFGTFIPKESFEESPRFVFNLGFGF